MPIELESYILRPLKFSLQATDKSQVTCRELLNIDFNTKSSYVKIK